MKDLNIDLLVKTASSIDNFDEWFDYNEFNNTLKLNGFSIETTGYSRLMEYLLSLPALFKIKVENLSSKKLQYYVTFIGKPFIPDDTLQKVENSITSVKSADVLSSIAENWKLEAKLESFRDYFYHLKEVYAILNKQKCYVIGRKGTGKSSISEYLFRLKSHDTFTEKLSFKNFPFNELYNLDNPSYTQPNQYITLWKYLIYSTVAKLMVQNQAIDAGIRQKLSELYSPDPIRSLSRTISQWTSAEFGATVLGNGGSLKVSRENRGQNVSWIDRVNNLEDIIVQYCDDSKYFIIFDELDEDYRTIKSSEHDTYNYLITSLFKAVQDVKSTLSYSKPNICPVVFLRDDIYSLVKDADKNKWRDYKVDIEWTSDKIKELLAYRISKDAELSYNLKFSDAWDLIFSNTNIKKSIGSFDYITRSTHLRPRDYIRFLQVCAEETLNLGREKIAKQTIKFVDRAFSNYLRDEIVDEIYPILPDISEILQIISNLRKWVFGVDEFKKEYLKYLKAKTVQEENVDFVLDQLYKFSVLGNQSKYRVDTLYFKYLHTNMTLNRQEKLVVHRGLFKALQII